jgi:alkanesulfonate monooxygenase SsuD/methylene tetrahydromethanopterin reductase-like flavin-dependent oxidoreductase (luciferase family)
VRFGLGLYTGQVPPDGDHDFRAEYARIVEQAQLAESLGIDSIWLSEHHGAADGYLPSLLPIAAAVLAATTTLQVGTAVMLAPFHDPLRLAEDVAVLDQLCGGRFILGLGTGWRSGEFTAFGLDPKRRVAMLEDTVSILRRAWLGQSFSFEGRTRSIDRAVVRPAPFTPGGPPIWLGGTGPRALRRAGELGDGHFGVAAPYDSAMATYDTALAACPPEQRGRFSFGQLRSGFIWDDPEEGWQLAGRGMGYTLSVHAGWAADEVGGAPAAPPTETGVRAYNVICPPQEMVGVLQPYAQRFAGRSDCHLALRLYHPYTRYEAVLRSIEMYGKDVLPALRDE